MRNQEDMKIATRKKDELQMSKDGWVRLIWVDCAGVRRCRVVRRSRLEQIKTIGLCYACLFLPCDRDEPPEHPAAAPVGEMRLGFDPSTLKPLPWRPTDAMALAYMYTYYDQNNVQLSKPWECCPRRALENALKWLENAHGINLICGFELEFILFKEPEPGMAKPITPIDHSRYCQTSAMENAADILDEMCCSLEELGLSIVQMHPESADGQFEISLGCKGAAQATDDLVYAKETISSIANQRGYIACFLPKPFPNQAGNGCHCHFSFHGTNGKTLFDPTGSSENYGLSQVGESFAAGVLSHLPSLMCFTTPNPNSYDRISPSTWSGAYQCWGFNNREAPLRLSGDPSDQETLNFEYKVMDSTANPYLAVTAIIAAGLIGIANSMRLPEEVKVDPVKLEKERPERLPLSLTKALDALEGDIPFQNHFDHVTGSETLRTAYVSVKRSECLTLESPDSSTIDTFSLGFLSRF